MCEDVRVIEDEELSVGPPVGGALLGFGSGLVFVGGVSCCSLSVDGS